MAHLWLSTFALPLARIYRHWNKYDSLCLAIALLLLAAGWLIYMLLHLRNHTPFFWPHPRMGKNNKDISASLPTSIIFLLTLTANAFFIFYIRTDTSTFPLTTHPLYAIPSLIAFIACPLYDRRNSR